MENNIVKWEEENAVNLQLGIEEDISSEEGDYVDVSEEESPEDYSDEESQAESIETIHRESGPEIEFNYDKRATLINKINENFWGDENLPTEGHKVEKGGIKESFLHNDFDTLITNEDSSIPLSFQSGDKSRPTQVEDNSFNYSIQTMENRRLVIKPHDFPISEKTINSQRSNKEVEKVEATYENISDKMKFLLSRTTPIGKKLKMVDEEESDKSFLDSEASKGKRNSDVNLKLEKRITRRALD
ncbi:hypothetical protein L2E82_20041 [Cichorium intybus]|uniref:Uncharacterized protein n=1 Tax=Cichorium intybus TaxID=13427 RepID=A0ACB9DRY3_CICIN|nr:hypothetical protein L2E82_20041 [Cichorium intybus]